MEEVLFFAGSMPLPPSVNKAYQVVYVRDVARIGPSAALTQFKTDAALTLSQAQCDWSVVQQIKMSRKKIPLEVSLNIYFKTMWKSDLDGRFKFAIDAAFARCGLNDNLVTKVDANKLVDASNPRVDIELRCLAQH